MRREKKSQKYFSLVELLVAIAVFVLMMVMLLQFLGGVQRIWSGTASRGDVYVESKAAMDLVVSLLRQGMYREYHDNDGGGDYQHMFCIMPHVDPNTGRRVDNVMLITRTDMPLTDTSSEVGMYLIRLGVGDKFDLRVQAVSADADADLYKDAVTIDRNNVVSSFAAFKSAWSKSLTDGVIAERVTAFELIPGYYNSVSREFEWKSGETRYKFPDALMIRMRMLDESKFRELKDLEAPEPDEIKQFLAENEMSFSRIIYFDFAESRGNVWE